MVTRNYFRTREDGVKLYKTESDSGFYILQNETNRKYEVAIDVENSGYTYSETDEKIKKDEESSDEESSTDDDSVLRESSNISSTSDNA
jgi:hypothetical protein